MIIDAFNIISLMSVFVLIALGLHFTFGMLGLVNLVHGELMLIGAYTAFVVGAAAGTTWAGVVAAPVVAGAVGLALERVVLRFLYHRPLDSLLATFGLAVIIRQTVQLLFSPNPRRVPDPLRGSIELFGINFPRWRLLVAVLVVALVVAVWAFLHRTGIGLRARAAVVNPDLAETVGLGVGRIRALLFVVGAAIAGLAGALLAPIQTIDPQFGLLFLVNSFLVVILGGPGSLGGLVASGVFLGGSLAVMQFYIPTVFAQIIVLVIAVVGVRLRPALVAGLAEWRSRRRPQPATTPSS